MANADIRAGLVPLHDASGAVYNGSARAYSVLASYATALFVGDAVVKVPGANAVEITDGTSSYPPGTLPLVNKATAGTGNSITGSIIGFGAKPDQDEITYNPASTEAVVFVADDPDLSFEIQDDGSAGLPVGTTAGKNANLVYTHAGNVIFGTSGSELNATTVAVGATLQLKILRLISRVENEIGINAKYEVKINNHTQASNTAGV